MNSRSLPPLSHLAKTIKLNGVYQHYKGYMYKVLAVGRHSENLEEFVVYQALYGDEDVWVRPITLFLENVTIDAQPKPRFKLDSD